MNRRNSARGFCGDGALGLGGLDLGPVAFTLIEVLTVISIIGLLAAIGAGMAGVASRKMKEATIKAQRDQLVTAIESYRGDFNQYPPDHAKNGVNLLPALSSLYYELVGTISANQGRQYREASRDRTITAQEVQSAFGVQGLVNSVESPERPKSYLAGLTAKQHAEIPVLGKSGLATVELLIVPVPWPKKLAGIAPLSGKVEQSAPTEKQLANPWNYVSTKPTNNPAAFDLWADAMIGKQRRTIGNWKE